MAAPRRPVPPPKQPRRSTATKPLAALFVALLAALVAVYTRRDTAEQPEGLEGELALRLGPAGDAAVSALLPWLAARGAHLLGAHAATFAGGLRGLAFAADAPPDTVVLSVPLSATLNAVTFSGAEQLRAAVAPDPLRGLGEEEEPHLYISTLVVLYELLTAPVSPWTPYLRTLPRSFDHLPAFFEDARPDGGAPRLWTHLGALAPLVAAQREEMSTLLPFVERAVRRMPRGADALAALQPGALQRMAGWAWGVARTRMLDQNVDAFPRGRQLMPPGVRKAPVLMPLLDLANHAEPNSSDCTAVVGAADGTVAFMTKRAVKAGEELRFTYIDSVGDAERDPSIRDEMCNDQWLSHYGFLLEDGRPERDCFFFELNLPALRQLVSADAGRKRGERRRLVQAGLPEAVHTVFDGTGTLWVGLLHWLSVAAGTAPADAPDDTAWQEDAHAWGMLAMALSAARTDLEVALREAEARNETEGGDGAAVRALAAGALRAAAAAEQQAQLGWARLVQSQQDASV